MAFAMHSNRSDYGNPTPHPAVIQQITTTHNIPALLQNESSPEWRVFWQAYMEVSQPDNTSRGVRHYQEEFSEMYSSDASMDCSLSPSTYATSDSPSSNIFTSPHTITNQTTPTSSAPSPSQKGTIYICPFCQKEFPKTHLLNKHLAQHIKPVSCPIALCLHATAKNRDMNRHIVTNHPDSAEAASLLSEGVYTCPVRDCKFSQKGFKRKDHLDRHYRNVHLKADGAKKGSKRGRGAG